jgi:hypothetical protein
LFYMSFAVVEKVKKYERARLWTVELTTLS